MKIIVLGSGMVGSVIGGDLASDFEVTCADGNPAALESVSARYPVKTAACDFRDAEAVAGLVASHDLVVGAVPGFLGFNVLKAVIESGKPVADISFFPEDAFELDELALKNGVTAVVDCGVAPGLCNLIAGRTNEIMKLNRYECLVGGLPVKALPPFHYKAPFSPIDVIEEYTRPARIVENGQVTVHEALSDIELVEFEPCGKLESFVTDGLRSLIATLRHVPDMKEKTLRYPGHAAAMKTLRDAGLFGKEKVNVGGKAVVPLDLTSQLLFRQWKYENGEEDFTILRVTLEGELGGKPRKMVHELYDRYDRESQTMSMARTTGYTCAAIVRLLAGGKYKKKGVSPPEYVGADETCYRFVMDYLSARRVVIRIAAE